MSVFEAFDPHNPPDPLPTAIKTRALWDTGATRSVISVDIARSLGLVPVGQVAVTHAGGTGQSPTYLVNFGLPNGVGLVGLLVTELPTSVPHRGFDAILGMDIIGFGDFSITNYGGKTCMTFRTPSCATVDYVEEGKNLAFAGVGRNDPCPCGQERSPGRPIKFKQCHGKN